MGSLAPTSPISYTLTALSGPEKGAVYKLVAGRVTLGRGSQNDICIENDTSMSRNHAVITIRNQKVEVSDVSGHNKVLVNGAEITTSEISPGTIIQLGNTKLQLGLYAEKKSTALTSVTSTSLNLSTSSNLNEFATTPSRKNPRSNNIKARKTNFYIVVGIAGLLFIWLLTAKVKPPAPSQIRNENTSQAEVDANKKILEQAATERQNAGVDTKQFEEAQPNFIKGFRDYRKGQYARAIESFQACLSLFPNHIQCQRSLRLSQKKFSELIQYNMILANKYRAQNQFTACMSSYRNVMYMLKNPNDKIYIEAKMGHDVCHALQGDRY